jgi:hypothetical protein
MLVYPGPVADNVTLYDSPRIEHPVQQAAIHAKLRLMINRAQST